MNKSELKNLLRSQESLTRVLSAVYNHIPFSNKRKIRGSNNELHMNAFMKNVQIQIDGNQNVINFGRMTRLNNCRFHIVGNQNCIIIDEECNLYDADICIEDDGGTVHVGTHTAISGKTHLACIEGCKITIGKECMFSANIVFRTGDSHSITDLSGTRINPSEDIQIGNHVWVGNHATVLKGSAVADNSIIGTGAIVTKKFLDPNVVIAGIPAAIVKRDINWDERRL